MNDNSAGDRNLQAESLLKLTRSTKNYEVIPEFQIDLTPRTVSDLYETSPESLDFAKISDQSAAPGGYSWVKSDNPPNDLSESTASSIPSGRDIYYVTKQFEPTSSNASSSKSPAEGRNIARELADRLAKDLHLNRDFNRDYQLLLEALEHQPENLEILNAVRMLTKEFLDMATSVGCIIINELFEQSKTIPSVHIGGIAGGVKYVYRNILYKICLDTELDDHRGWMHGGTVPNDEKAMKTGAHELRGLMHYSSLRVSGLHFPLMLVMDYKGFRLVAEALLPINKETIAYGSSDGGETVHASGDELCHMMKMVGQQLHLAPHIVKNKVIYGPGDQEVHMGFDGRFYCIDLARVFPCEPAKHHLIATSMSSSSKSKIRRNSATNPNSSTSMPSSPGPSSVLPTNVTTPPTTTPSPSLHQQTTLPSTASPLVPTGFSPVPFNTFQQNEARSSSATASPIFGIPKKAIVYATSFDKEQQDEPRSIFYKFFRPEFILSYKKPLASDCFTGWGKHDPNFQLNNKDVIEAFIHLKAFIIPKFATMFDKMMIQCKRESDPYTVWKYFNAVEKLHSYGINVRHLGLIRKNSATEFGRALLLNEMIARVAKNMIRKRLREEMKTYCNLSNEHVKDIIISHYNYILGKSSKPVFQDKNQRSHLLQQLQQPASSSLTWNNTLKTNSNIINGHLQESFDSLSSGGSATASNSVSYLASLSSELPIDSSSSKTPYLTTNGSNLTNNDEQQPTFPDQDFIRQLLFQFESPFLSSEMSNISKIIKQEMNVKFVFNRLNQMLGIEMDEDAKTELAEKSYEFVHCDIISISPIVRFMNLVDEAEGLALFITSKQKKSDQRIRLLHLATNKLQASCVGLPNNFNAMFYWARSLFDHGKLLISDRKARISFFEKALEKFQLVTKLRPGHVKAWRYQVRIWIKLCDTIEYQNMLSDAANNQLTQNDPTASYSESPSFLSDQVVLSCTKLMLLDILWAQKILRQARNTFSQAQRVQAERILKSSALGNSVNFGESSSLNSISTTMSISSNNSNSNNNNIISSFDSLQQQQQQTITSSTTTSSSSSLLSSNEGHGNSSGYSVVDPSSLFQIAQHLCLAIQNVAKPMIDAMFNVPLPPDALDIKLPRIYVESLFLCARALQCRSKMASERYASSKADSKSQRNRAAHFFGVNQDELHSKRLKLQITDQFTTALTVHLKNQDDQQFVDKLIIESLPEIAPLCRSSKNLTHAFQKRCSQISSLILSSQLNNYSSSSSSLLGLNLSSISVPSTATVRENSKAKVATSIDSPISSSPSNSSSPIITSSSNHIKSSNPTSTAIIAVMASIQQQNSSPRSSEASPLVQNQQQNATSSAPPQASSNLMTVGDPYLQLFVDLTLPHVGPLLTSIDVSGCKNIPNSVMLHLFERCNATLTSLDISDLSNVSNPWLQTCTSSLTKLNKLTARGLKISDDTISILATKHGATLEYLDVASNSISNEGFLKMCKHLAVIKHLDLSGNFYVGSHHPPQSKHRFFSDGCSKIGKTVKHFSVLECYSFTNQSLESVSQKLKALTHLSLSSKLIADQYLLLLESLMPQLISLSLRAMTNSDSAFATLLSHVGPQCTSLSLRASMGISDNAIAALQKACNLQTLHLGLCKHIQGSSFFSLSQHLQSITDLDLCDTEASPASMIQFVQRQPNLQILNISSLPDSIASDSIFISLISNAPKLKELQAYANPNITGKSIEALSKLCPRLEILNISDCHNLTDIDPPLLRLKHLHVLNIKYAHPPQRHCLVSHKFTHVKHLTMCHCFTSSSSNSSSSSNPALNSIKMLSQK